ncbi:MAG: amino acid adenylation domain-containing protein [Halanaerobiales bacterium]|nr:amino acid adenylation domain-containing protein [Halanaerobiales bacterium]
MSDVEERTNLTGLEIAVIGMSGRFPGAKNIDQFWENLKNGVESLSFFSDEELIESGVDPKLLKKTNYIKAKGYLEDIEYFDPAFFDYTPREAELMDPQLRIFHESAWVAIENAGYVPESYEGLIGLYAGTSANLQWLARTLSGIKDDTAQFDAISLNDRDFLSTRIAYKLNLKGPSFTVQTACSTSLVAIHLAIQGLLSGDCDIALTGGVSVTLPKKNGYQYQDGMIYSVDGHCRAFDAEAKGTNAGNGVGIVVLKRLEDALEDGDTIHAVVKGSAINNDGTRKVGYTAPSVEGQVAVIRAAQQMAEVEAESISYVETHGTATVLGDPIEVESLKRAFDTDKRGYCKIGSVKTNIGHLDAAAGVASFIKTVLALKHREIPASLHFKNPSPKIDFENSPFVVNAEHSKWENAQYPLRAGVSSFGIGGTNAHVILEEAFVMEKSSASRPWEQIMLSAKTRPALERATENLTEYLKNNPNTNFADLAYTLKVGRKGFKYRKMLVCSDINEVIDGLSPAESAKIQTSVADENHRPIVFMFSGQGSQYVNMGLQLYETESAFRDIVDQCFEILQPVMGIDLKEVIYPFDNIDEANEKVNQTYITQPLIFTFEYALAQLLMNWGIKPYAMIGHSIGEYVAATLSGVFSLEDALTLVAMRGKLMQELSSGSMLSIPLSSNKIEPLLKEYGQDRLSIAAINAASSTVISGSHEAIDQFAALLKEKGYESRALHTSHAFHSMMMNPILDRFEAKVKEIKLNKPEIPYISNVSGNWITVEDATDSKYWVKHLRGTVRFADGLSELLKKEKAILIEVGPRQVLSSFARQHLAKKPEQLVINLVRHPKENASDLYYLLNKVGRLWASGVDIDWTEFYAEERRHRIPLPTYSFDRVYFNSDVLSQISGENLFSSASLVKEDQSKATTLYSRTDLLEIFIAPRDEIEEKVVDIYQIVLGISQISIHENFFELGGDSLKAVSVAAQLEKEFAVEIPLSDIFSSQDIESFAAIINTKLSNKQNQDENLVKKVKYIAKSPDKENLHLPFPLTDIQIAYVIGRDEEFEMGGISTHVYQEIEAKIEIQRLESALNKIIKRHPMLRAVVVGNKQQILSEIPYYKIDVEDLTDFDSLKQQERILKERDRMSHFVFNPEKWPLFEVKSFKLSNDTQYICLGFDLLIGDAASIRLIGEELMVYYQNPELTKPVLEFTFRDYILALEDLKKSEIYQMDREYWLAKLDDFPSAPALPYKCNPSEITKPHFNRHRKEFTKEEWASLQNIAKHKNLTPSAVLSTAYAEVLAFWSNQPKLAFNLTIFNRFPFHKDVNQIIGDFTSVVLLGIDLKADQTFWDNAREIQKTLIEGLEHRHYDGVEFIREIGKRNNSGTQANMPFIFTSMLFGNDTESETPFLGEVKMNISQTSQVFIDNQVGEENGQLIITWDYVEDLFEPEVISAIFEQYIMILSHLIEDKTNYKLQPSSEVLNQIEEYNQTDEDIPATTLHENFIKQAKLTPDKIAVEFNNERLTYRELDERSNQVAAYLREVAVGRNGLIGVITSRSIETIVNVMGVLKAGPAYVPIDPEYPEDRKNYIYEHSKCKMLIKPDLYTTKNLSTYPVDELDNINDPKDLAYVIYTSGSTGRPKGVVITHKAANNTIIDINQRYGITENDRILGISSMCFDLSVYDVFGALSIGAKLVLIKSQKDIQSLIEALDTNEITIWNSVPSILDLVCENLSDGYVNHHLRKVMLSGDWIPLKLPGRIKKHFLNTDVISQGGATEGSIWSIYYPIEEVKEHWKSIPYGYPLANQQFYVLNYMQEFCPIGVQGELYIGGDGVAVGYMNDQEKTKNAFIEHPELGKVYKTGDYGIFHQEGYIEFLGRKDHQIKIRGYRIELGEIESCLLEYDTIKNVIVIDRVDETNKKYLCAYIVSDISLPIAELRAYLAEKLPDYMIPSYFIHLDKIPLTANGKVDRKALPKPNSDVTHETNYIGARNELEEKLIAIWESVLEVDDIGIHDNFFELGGDSLIIQKLINQIEQTFNTKVPISGIFRKQTIADLSEYMSGQVKETPKTEQVTVDLSGEKVYYWSPVVHWEQTDNKVLIGEESYTGVALNAFPKLYFLAQKGVTLDGLLKEFQTLNSDQMNQLINDLVQNQVLISGLLNLPEVFSTQRNLFTNKYGEEILVISDMYKKFKMEQLDRSFSQTQDVKVSLVERPEVWPSYIKDRRSHRKYDEFRKISFESFSQMLSIFKQTRKDGRVTNYYASSGGLYAIDVFIYVKPGRVENLEKGLYYYNPIDNSLDLVDQDAPITTEAHYFKNKEIFKTSAFSIFMIYNADVNMPMYSSNGYFYATIDTGIMVGSLTQAAELSDIGLCSIGEMNFEVIREHFKLNDNQKWVHTIEGGLKSEDMDEIILDCYPLSGAQKRLFVLDKIDPESMSYNNPGFMMVEGLVDKDKIERIFKELIQRHETLRTTFELVNNEPMQKVHQDFDFEMEYYELPEDQVQEIVKAFIRPFDLTKAPLLRLGLIKIAEEKHILLLDIHHIVGDRTAGIILLKELLDIYEGKELRELKYQYKDFAIWQNQLIEAGHIKEQEDYWLNQFSEEIHGPIPVLNLPTDYPRPSTRSFEGNRYYFKLNKELTDNLRSFGYKNEATLFMVMLAAYNVLLAKYSGQDDIIIGTPISGRRHANYESVIGMFANTLALRNHPKSELSFAEFLRNVKEKALDGFENQDYPFERLVENLKLQREMSRNPLFDTMFVLQNMGNAELKAKDLRFLPYEFDYNLTKFDLRMEAVEINQEVEINFEYCTKLFKKETIERLAGHLINILNEVLKTPDIKISNLEMISNTEKQQIANVFNDTALEYSKDKTFVEIFEEQVTKSLDDIAVAYQDSSLTYQKLNLKANQLARTLRSKGIMAEDIVGLMVDRSVEMIVGMLGILKAGGAYMAAGPDYPQARIEFMLEDSGAKILLTQKHLLEQAESFSKTEIILIDDENQFLEESSNLEVINKPENLAYVIYTSGTTGKPKGVMVEYRNLNNLVFGLQERIYNQYSEKLRIALISPYVFDASIKMIFAALSQGHGLYIVPEDTRLDGEKLLEFYDNNRINISDGTPTHMELLLDSIGDQCLDIDLKNFIVGGEALQKHTVERLLKAFKNPELKVTNVYGPTECTVDTTSFEISKKNISNLNTIPIGQPMPNYQVYILDNENRVQPIGVPGELCIGGDGVARGYLNREELTKEKFIQDPFNQGGRLYRSGDLARWTEDGTIEYMGRIDNQVKIRGFRIELGEIESKLLEYDYIQDAAVIARENEQGGKYLCGYIVPVKTDFELLISEIRGLLARELPEYMIPSYFVQLENLPLTINGKLNKRALPEPEVKAEAEYVAAKTSIEEILVAIWQKILRVESIGVNDNFFEVGGDSIKAIQMSSMLRKEGLKVETRDFFLHPTIKELSKAVKKIKRVIDQSVVEGEVKLTPIQSSFFENLIETNHYNQAAMLYSKEGFDQEHISNAFTKIVEHHDALRMIYEINDSQIIQKNRPVSDKLFDFELFDFRSEADVEAKIEREANKLQSGIMISEGPLVKLGLFKTNLGDHFMIVIHHLVVDGVSWRVLLEDFAIGYQQSVEGVEISLQDKTDSYKYWSEELAKYAESQDALEELVYWKEIQANEFVSLPRDCQIDQEMRKGKNYDSANITLSKDQTNQLLKEVNWAYNTEINDILLSALGMTINKWAGLEKILITLEGHGREEIIEDMDISRTVGWFTSKFPVLLDMSKIEEFSYSIKSVKEILRRIPNKGIGYGILKYLTPDEKKVGLQFNIQPEISFNYLGEFDQTVNDLFTFSNISMGNLVSPERERKTSLNINGMIVEEKLTISFTYNKYEYEKESIEKLIDCYKSNLLKIVEHCIGKDEKEVTPSDLGDNEVSIEELDEIKDILDL